MEIVLRINPLVDSRIEYLWAAHPRPWSLNVGKLLESGIDAKTIRAKFTVTAIEAMKSEFWDKDNSRVFIEVYDVDGRVVINNWLDMKGQTSRTATLCLGE